ncbi:MAG TPA: flagellar basal body P-ring protein FlgI [Steroidobacteraceae bacterium]|nr:flagellar basal body P-ring protein FlgI [Steroidobacteraceae bacterium]
MRTFTHIRALLTIFSLGVFAAAHAGVRIKDIGRFDGVRDNLATGYGLVVGLAGTGDSSRVIGTSQSYSNMLQEFGLHVPPGSIASRNIAMVMVQANLPAYLHVGDKLDVTVSSAGDASSLAGGTLLVTQLLGVDRQLYATAQGPLAVGGFKFEQNGTLKQKNHPTAATIPDGAIAEKSIVPTLVRGDGSLQLILHDPDFVTATRVAEKINASVPAVTAAAVEAGMIRLHPAGASEAQIVSLVARVEALSVDPDEKARVVVSERTGTIVAGGTISLSSVTITQGDLKVAITQRYLVSQPQGLIVAPGSGVATAIVPESDVNVQESEVHAVSLPEGATIEELVRALRAIRVSTRDVIAILQGIKRAGALHAELIVQ